MSKPFCKNLYAENDADSKSEGMLLIESLVGKEGNKLFNDVKNCKENYKYDFSAFSLLRNKEIKFEVERKKLWKDVGYFPVNFRDVQVPARKMKCEADIFIMFNYHYNTALWILMEYIKECETRNINTYNYENDSFFVIPVLKFTLLEKNNDQWKRISARHHLMRRREAENLNYQNLLNQYPIISQLNNGDS